MERAQELAAIRERTRIARDIHDVLAHSLSVLSIQTQAARLLVSHDPGRLEAKLDEMATLHYALRESLTNAYRHGAARTIWVSSRWLHEKVILQIHDDGRGATASGAPFNVREPEAGHGLQGMRERASELGGVMEARALPKRGFLVTVSVPLLYNDASTRKDL